MGLSKYSLFGKGRIMRSKSLIEAICILVAALLLLCGQSQAASVFYDDFDDGNFDGWVVQHPYSPSGSSLTPEIVPSPEGYSIRGVGSGYSSSGEGAYLGRPVTMNNIGSLTIEMYAKSGPSWPNTASVWLLNDTEYYRGMDYGESNHAATLQVNLAGVTTHPGWYSTDYNWHMFTWDRDTQGYWSLSIDGQVKQQNFWQDTTLTSFNKIALEVTRNQSEIEWVRVSGEIVPEPATMSLLALGLGALAMRRRKKK